MSEKTLTVLKILALLVSVVFLAKAQAEYDVIERFSLLEDRLATHKILLPFEESSFLWDVRAYSNKNLRTLYRESKEVMRKPASQRSSAARNLLRKYDRSEQALIGGTTLGVHLARFKVYGVHVVSEWKTNLRLGALLGVRTRGINSQDILEYIGSNIPEFIRQAIAGCALPDPGEDVVQNAIDNNCLHRFLGRPFVGRYFFPSDSGIPQILTYHKSDLRSGLRFSWGLLQERFFGVFGLYWRGRADSKVRITDESIRRGKVDLLNIPNRVQQSDLSADYLIGYRDGNFSSFLSVEELKMATFRKRDKAGGKMEYGNDPLWRLHGAYLFSSSYLTLQAYSGVHWRRHYGIADSVYLGCDFLLSSFKDRLKMRLRTRLDREHFTLAPLVKFWWMDWEVLLKEPIRGNVEGVKPSTLWGLNLRFSV